MRATCTKAAAHRWYATKQFPAGPDIEHCRLHFSHSSDTCARARVCVRESMCAGEYVCCVCTLRTGDSLCRERKRAGGQSGVEPATQAHGVLHGRTADGAVAACLFIDRNQVSQSREMRQ